MTLAIVVEDDERESYSSHDCFQLWRDFVLKSANRLPAVAGERPTLVGGRQVL